MKKLFYVTLLILIMFLIIFLFKSIIKNLNYLVKNYSSFYNFKFNGRERGEFFKSKKDAKKPKLYIIIDDVGYDKIMLEKFLKLNLNLNYSIIPFLKFSKESYEMILEKKRVPMIHMPMAAKNAEIEEFGIKGDDEESEIQQKMEKAIFAYSKALVINNHMGSLITEQDDKMRIILKVIDSKKRFFFDSFTTALSKAQSVAKELNLRVEKRDVFLDHIDERREVKKELKLAKEKAKKSGIAKVIGHIWSENTLSVLKEEESELNREFELESIVNLYKDN